MIQTVVTPDAEQQGALQQIYYKSFFEMEQKR